MKYPIPKTVKEAAEILDKAIPGWHERIDTSILSLGDSDTCILGQLAESSGLQAVDLREKLLGQYSWAKLPLFCCDTYLTTWKDEIENRKNSYKKHVFTSVVSEHHPITIQYEDGYLEKFKSTLDIPFGKRYKLVSG